MQAGKADITVKCPVCVVGRRKSDSRPLVLHELK